MAMALHGMLMQLSLVGVIVLAAATTAAAQALTGCPDRCGNLTIPYPFGIKEGCHLAEDKFFLNCTESSILRKRHIVVNNISLDGELHVFQSVFRDCYTAQGVPNHHISPQLSVYPFTISDTKNNLVVVGCDAYAIFNGWRSNKEKFIAGCMSLCESLGSVDKNSCSGIGCCQISIPATGLEIVVMELSSFLNNTRVWEFSRCSYAFMVEKGKFIFSNRSFLEMESIKQLPLVVNWEIGDEPCDVAEKRKNFSCMRNSKCASPNNRSGYTCQCLPGYQGNPYHPDGCQDIDECKMTNPCNIGTTCKNLIGTYSCIKVNSSNQSARTLLIISLATGSGLGLFFLLIGGTWWLRKVIKKRKNSKRKEKFFKQNGGLLLQKQLSSGEVNVEKINLFNSKELEKATDRFNADRILGQGGQGTVYKGMLADGRIVAVKKSKIVNGDEVGQFINEIVILSQIIHRNVVKLLGCCLETEVPLLVYEFIPNGTLTQYIHEQISEEFPLTWEMRLRVATEVSGALSYLHSSASLPIYHRDIKSSNILLDEKYRAKVADFGTSRSVAIDQTHLTTLVYGTFGYLDPEYFQSSQFTDKSDVYSFGVVLAELLTGQKPVSQARSQEGRSLATYFLVSMEKKRLFEILDAAVMKDGQKEVIVAVANLARRCLNLKGKKRPTMKEVAAELEGIQLSVTTSDVQQHFEEVEYARSELLEAWDVVSTSTGSNMDTGTGPPLDVQPLLSFKSQ